MNEDIAKIKEAVQEKCEENLIFTPGLLARQPQDRVSPPPPTHLKTFGGFTTKTITTFDSRFHSGNYFKQRDRILLEYNRKKEGIR